MDKAINKLGLTDSERAIHYTDNGSVRIAEVRHYDPVMGLLKIVDPMNGLTHEMIYSSTSKKLVRATAQVLLVTIMQKNQL